MRHILRALGGSPADMRAWRLRIRRYVCRRFGHQQPWTWGDDPRLPGPILAGCDYCAVHNVPASGRRGL